jgi:hypothetical protein
MILYRDDNRTGNLYFSRIEDGSWSRATKLEAPISTGYWESHGCLSRDGKVLYFTSNREGGYGGLDIYRAEQKPGGKWGEPVNLGPVINSPYNEQAPWISSDGRTLVFISFGHGKMGGYDIFYSRMQADGTWGEPVNPGYPVNTTRDDLYFQPLDVGTSAFDNGSGAIVSIYRPGGIGGHDIYRLNLGQ